MQYIDHLPREVQGTPLDIIAPVGGFGPLIEQIASQGLLIEAHDPRGKILVVTVSTNSSESLVPARGEEVFLENCTVTLLDEMGHSTGIHADAWVSLNPEVKTADLPAGKLIVWNPRQINSKEHDGYFRPAG